MSSTNSLLNMKDVTSRLGLCRRTVERMVSSGRFPRGLRVSPRNLRWRAADVEAFIASRATEAAAHD